MPEAVQTEQPQTQQTTQTQTPPVDGQQQTTQQQTTTQPAQRTDAVQNNGQSQQDRGLIADLQKERKARQQLQSQFEAAQTSLAAERRRIQALVDVTPKSEQDQELDVVRERLKQAFPILGKLTEEKLDQLLGIGEQANGMNEAVTHHWANHGRQMLGSLSEQVADAIGSDLTERQKSRLERAYVAQAESDPEFLRRHQAGDPKLVADFAKEWVEDWFEPARKQVVNTEVARQRRVPNGRDRNVQTTPPKAIDFKNPQAVEDALVASFKQHGGKFGE